MSLEQSQPFQTAPVQFDADERKCENCEHPVTLQYARVMGDNQNRVHECPHCPEDDSTQGDRLNGAAAGRDPEPRGAGYGGQE